MKIKDLKGIIYSRVSDIQMCVVWDSTELSVLAKCSIENAIKEHGDKEVSRIYTTYDGELVISVK